MGTVRSGASKKSAPLAESRVRVIREGVHVDHIHTQMIQFTQAYTDGTIPVEEVDVIVSGDRGTKNLENLTILKELVDLLGGTMGCSRTAVDPGWMPQFR